MFEFRYLETRDELADFLNIPLYKLNYLLYVKRIENLYTTFEIPKKNGGVRHISAPDRDLKYVQRCLADALWKHQVSLWGDKINKLNISHAYEKNKSIITNATIHKNKHIVINIDLLDFFGSFHFGRVLGFFKKNRNFQLPHGVAVVIAQIACYQGALPQGAPSSPIITNLVCQILDYKILGIAKKYRLDYTRYADDLTFSTNNKIFISREESFLCELEKAINKAGFQINNTKTRLIYKSSRQVVTGLTINKKLSVSKEYYKNTRAMAHSLYKTGEFHINGELGSTNQLEGRLTFICQVEKHSKAKTKKSQSFRSLTQKEKQLQMFMFFKYFFNSSTPVIITEGETDIIYFKAALRKHYTEFPDLIKKTEENKFEYSFSFLRRSPRFEYLFGLVEDGADTMQQIYNFFTGSDNSTNYLETFTKLSDRHPTMPVLLLFDNELSNVGKPIRKFTKHANFKSNEIYLLQEELSARLAKNLFLVTHQLTKGLAECEIEDLFDDRTLSLEIDGKRFSRDSFTGNSSTISKRIFAKHVSDNYNSIDFSGFLPYLYRISSIISNYIASQTSSDL